ncbi:MAG: S8 family serine peptidase [Treponema sp.]|nr:S8 family serine peptidase [Treponema sp.]
MNKRKQSIFLLLFLPLTILMMQCQFEPAGGGAGKNTSRSGAGRSVEEKIYSYATLEDDFAEDRVVVVLTKAASMNFRAYTPEDFSEVNCIRVVDSTRLTMEVVQEQLRAEKTGDWSKLKERIEMGMLVNVDKFKRILDLDLPVQSKENVLQAIKLLEQREDVLYAGPDYFMELYALPSPTPGYLSNQMAALNSTSLPAAWDIVNTNSYSVLVGVLDGGIQADHPGLNTQVYLSLWRDFSTGDPNGMGPNILLDHRGHGTHVAGIIGANGTGVIGAGWGIPLISLRVFNANGRGSFSNVRYAIDYGNNIPILNFSGGGYYNDYSLHEAIQLYPGLFVCAAGNDKTNNDTRYVYPASWTVDTPQYPHHPNYMNLPYLPGLPNLISVGALDNNDNAAYFSNFGAASVDLFAPGTGIWSTFINSGYEPLSGTSMAAPFVTGVAALVKSLHYLHMTAPELKILLLASVDELPQLSGLCATSGKLNAYKAVTHVPIIGSIDISFNGIGPIGKFHLFDNGRWTITEMGFNSYPISYHPTTHPGYVQLGPVPSEISDYIIQIGISSVNGVFFVAVPTLSVTGNLYFNYMFSYGISNSGVQLNYAYVSYSLPGTIPSGDMRKIRTNTIYGGY